MSMELVIIAPVIIFFMMLLVGLGRIVEARGQVYGAARDAARAASVSRGLAEANANARATALQELKGWCRPKTLTARPVAGAFDFRPGGEVTYRVTCDVDLTGLSMIGFVPTKRLHDQVTVPLEQFRGTQ